MLIEIHTLEELIDTMVLPAAFAYLAILTESAANAKAAGIKVIPQIDAANQIGTLIAELRTRARGARKGDREGRGDARRSGSAGRACSRPTVADRMADVR